MTLDIQNGRTDIAPELTVIIPHYNDLLRLETCLAALVPQLAQYPQAEAVVVDNASPVDLVPMQEKFPTVRFITESTKGAAAARNRGVADTRGAKLLFLDSDCVPAPDWLGTALALECQDKALGGRVDTFDETPAPRSGAEAFETVFAFHQKDYVEKKGFSVTANLLTSRAVFEDVGPMIVGLSEDVDWCQRATAKGYALNYVDSLQVAHPTRQDWSALVKKWRRTAAEGYLLNGTDARARLRWVLRAGMVLVSPLLHTPQVLTHPGLSGPGDRIRALGTLFRLRLTRTGWMIAQALTNRA